MSQPGLQKLQYTYCPISHNVSQPDNEICAVNRNIFFKNHAENEAVRLVPVVLLLLKKINEVKTSHIQLNFNILYFEALNLACNQTNCI